MSQKSKSNSSINHLTKTKKNIMIPQELLDKIVDELNDPDDIVSSVEAGIVSKSPYILKKLYMKAMDRPFETLKRIKRDKKDMENIYNKLSNDITKYKNNIIKIKKMKKIIEDNNKLIKKQNKTFNNEKRLYILNKNANLKEKINLKNLEMNRIKLHYLKGVPKKDKETINKLNKVKSKVKSIIDDYKFITDNLEEQINKTTQIFYNKIYH